MPQRRYCGKCGYPISGTESVCKGCGAPVSATDTNAKGSELTQNTASDFILFRNIKCLPAMIVGIIAATFGILGGACTTACTSMYGAGEQSLFLIVGGSILGLVGACISYKKAIIGGLLQLTGALLMTICAYSSGAELMTILSYIMFYVSGAMGLIMGLVKALRK